jgi:hypothetical protein
MSKVKIGKLTFKEYATKKPVMIKPTGEFVEPAEISRTPSLALGSLFALSEDQQIKLAVERNRLEPDYKLGILGIGIVSKDEVIEHIQSKTELGQEIVRAEMSYSNQLISDLRYEKTAVKPEMPSIEVELQPEMWNWIPPDWWKKWIWFFRRCALFCEDTTDSVTIHPATYRINKVHPAFKKKGFCLFELKGVNDVRSVFAPKAKNFRVTYISGVGHGSPTRYTGHLGDPILTKCTYDPKEVKGKIIHLLSCQTAKELGPDLIKKGAKAYAGYFENFTFVYDQPGTPVDEMELFWDCDSTFDFMMAAGKKVEEAHNATIAMYNAAIAAVPNTAAATWLTWDRNYFRSPVIDSVYGDKTARIYPYFLIPIPFMELEEPISP